MSSFNIDPRSYATNLETGATIANCPSLAAEVKQQMDALDRAYEKDRSCSNCKKEFIPANMRPGVVCGVLKSLL